MKGLMLLMGKGAKGPKGMESEDSAPEGPERAYAREAFSAFKDDDEEGFVEAFVSAVEACASKAKSGEYEAEE